MTQPRRGPIPSNVSFTMRLSSADLNRLAAILNAHGSGSPAAQSKSKSNSGFSAKSLALGIGIYETLKGMANSSKILVTYQQGYSKILGAMIDVLLTPFIPLFNLITVGLNKLLIWLIDSGYIEKMTGFLEDTVHALGTIGGTMHEVLTAIKNLSPGGVKDAAGDIWDDLTHGSIKKKLEQGAGIGLGAGFLGAWLTGKFTSGKAGLPIAGGNVVKGVNWWGRKLSPFGKGGSSATSAATNAATATGEINPSELTNALKVAPTAATDTAKTGMWAKIGAIFRGGASSGGEFGMVLPPESFQTRGMDMLANIIGAPTSADRAADRAKEAYLNKYPMGNPNNVMASMQRLVDQGKASHSDPYEYRYASQYLATHNKDGSPVNSNNTVTVNQTIQVQGTSVEQVARQALSTINSVLGFMGSSGSAGSIGLPAPARNGAVTH